MLLAGDIGGTKTHLAIYASKDKLRTPLLEARLPSAHYPSLAALVRDFLKNVKFSLDQAVFGVAGPVVNGKARITNLPWVMEEGQLQKELNIARVVLINDLEALANAVPLLNQSDVHVLNMGEAEPQGPIAVIAPGTGLGEAFLTWDGTRYRTYPSEGGHADFAPTDSFEIGLLVYMLERLSHVSYEHVCSGIGLPNIYAYLKASGTFEEPRWLVDKLAQAADQPPIIVNAALDEREPVALCSATLRMFTSILGAEAGNMALKVLATGGVYIGGGIPPRILAFLEDKEFMRAFRNKGRFSDLLANIPVRVILNSKTALLGAAAYGFDDK
jgi:glucokinase